MKNRFKVIALHTHTECNRKCSFCYRKKKPRSEQLDFRFFYELIPKLSKYTNQLAVGGGESFYFPEKLKKMAEIADNSGLIFNVTSNGDLLEDKTDEELKELLEHVTMISISMDKEKRGTVKRVRQYFKLVDRIKSLKLCGVGCNLLVDKKLVKNRIKFIAIINHLMKHVDRVFCLYPKNFKGPDILEKPVKGAYYLLTSMHEFFYVDDLTNKVLTEDSYSGWKKPCHYGKILSIDETGAVKGCSFEEKPLFIMNKPEDIRKIESIEIPERFECPYLKR